MTAMRLALLALLAAATIAVGARAAAPAPAELTFACELPASKLTALLSDREVIDDLRQLKAGVAVATIDFSAERAAAVRKLNDAGIPVTAWLVLPEREGYFFDAENFDAAQKRFAAFQIWTRANHLRWVAVGLDIEPDIRELGRLAHRGGWSLLPVFVGRLFDYGEVRAAGTNYAGLLARIHAAGWQTQTYQFPFIADERAAGSTVLQRLVHLVDVKGDHEVLMLYSSFTPSYGAGLIEAYGVDADAIAIGSTGGDSKLDGGTTPLDWTGFLRDYRAARRWTRSVGVYSLEGSVRRGFLRRLASMSPADLAVTSGEPAHADKARWFRFGVKTALFLLTWWFVVAALVVLIPIAGWRMLRRSALRNAMETR
jgi:hypothetical protein